MLATDRTTRVISFDALKPSLSPLFRDALFGRGRSREFFDLGYDVDDLKAAAERQSAYPRDRTSLAKALVDLQTPGTAGHENARALAEPDTLAVVTGQQSVLFGGPLYVLYKALGAISLARVASEKLKRRVVPVFWVASDDHDFAEIRTTTVTESDGSPKPLRYEPHEEPSLRPASRIALDDTISSLVTAARHALPESPWKDEVSSRLAATYAAGVSISRAFTSFLSSYLPELVIFDPADPRLKALMLPVIEREIRELSPTSRLAATIGEKLLAASYHQQVPVRASGFLNLFVVEDDRRRALAVNGEGAAAKIEARGTSKQYSPDELIARLKARPEDASPSVMLRPIAQDHVLPTIAYVGGPAEIAYHAQIGPSYAHFGVPRPVIFPRPSLTIIDASTARAMEAESLSFEDLQGDVNALLSDFARSVHPEIEQALADARARVDGGFQSLEEALATLDATLRGAAQSARGRALHQIEGLQEKALRAMKRQDATRAERLRRTRDALFPGGGLQERGLSWLWLIARYGPSLIDEVRDRMDLWARGHQIVSIQ